MTNQIESVIKADVVRYFSDVYFAFQQLSVMTLLWIRHNPINLLTTDSCAATNAKMD